MRLVNRRRTGREAGWVMVATSCWRAVRGARGEGRAREQARAAVSQARESREVQAAAAQDRGVNVSSLKLPIPDTLQ